MKKKNKIPKTNKFVIDLPKHDHSFMITEMIKNGKAQSRIIPDQKKLKDKKNCRGKIVEE